MFRDADVFCYDRGRTREWDIETDVTPYRDIPRTWDKLIRKLWKWFETHPAVELSVSPEVSVDYSSGKDDGKAWGIAA